MAMVLKMGFLQKFEAAGYCIELDLGTAILTVAAWFLACIWQPNNPSCHKHNNFLGSCVHLNCLSAQVLDHHHTLAIVEDTTA